ncbi:MAG: M48 family metallopeptidase [Celeribacter sp.]|jgi:predicted Zn-dependent protease
MPSFKTLLAATGITATIAACEVVPIVPTTPVAGGNSSVPPVTSPEIATRNFASVVSRVEPVAEQLCRSQTSNLNCDFRIVVDKTPNAAPNAFQTQDEQGRPIVAFTASLIADARNQDELAFILGHETAHHIEGHLVRTRNSAQTGALIGGVLATLGGGSDGLVQTASRLGAEYGVRRYSKAYELEADSLGTVIAYRAGYDPVNGAEYFARIPDPGDSFLSTHPGNAERVATVRRVRNTLN